MFAVSIVRPSRPVRRRRFVAECPFDSGCRPSDFDNVEVGGSSDFGNSEVGGSPDFDNAKSF